MVYLMLYVNSKEDILQLNTTNFFITKEQFTHILLRSDEGVKSVTPLTVLPGRILPKIGQSVPVYCYHHIKALYEITFT